jgi:hypothetical protein
VQLESAEIRSRDEGRGEGEANEQTARPTQGKAPRLSALRGIDAPPILSPPQSHEASRVPSPDAMLIRVRSLRKFLATAL